MEWYRFLKPTLTACTAVALLSGCATKLETYRKQGLALYERDQLEESREIFNKALAEDQAAPVSNAYVGLIDYRAGRLEQAEFHFRLALDLDPSSEEAKSGLAVTLIKMGKPDQALDALERAAELARQVPDPSWRRTEVKRPYTYQIEENLFKGKTRDCLRIARAYSSPDIGDYDNAFVWYEKALKEAGQEDPTILMSMADLAERAKNPAKTREYLGRTYRADPATPGLLAALARNNIPISQILGTGNGSK
jgi:tetratricopeptide (TPR) repeat protein